MSQSSWQKHQQSLDTLQSMVNAVLIETGNALRSANRKGPKTIGYTHDRLQGFLPSAIDKFHLALDELEGDIVRAKAVLGRDLRELQARRKNLEHPQAGQTENEVIPEGPVRLAQLLKPQALVAPEFHSLAVFPDGVKGEDISIENIVLPEKQTPEPKTEGLSEKFSPSSKIQGQVKAHGSFEQTMQNQEAGTDTKIPHGSGVPEVMHGLGITTSGLSSQDSEAPVTGGLQEKSFDPLSETADNGDSSLNFEDFDFTLDNNNGQNEGFAVSAGDFDLSSFGDQAKTVDGDPGDMLSGLDNFGNDSDGNDFRMLNLSNATANQNTDQTGGEDFGMSGGDLEYALGMDPNGSSFDDLLNGMDFGDGDNATAGEIMDHGEFDGTLFSTQ